MNLIDPTQKEIIEEQKAYLKGKPLKYKLQYFVEYYLKTVLLIGAALAIVITLIVTALTNKDHDLYVVFINAINVPESSDFEAYAGTDARKNEVIYDHSVYIDIENIDQTSYISIQKWMAVIAAADCDIMIGDRKTLENYVSSNYYADLSEFLSDEQKKTYGDRLIECDVYDDDGDKTGSKAAFFMDVTNAPLLTEYATFPQDEVVLAVAVNTKRPERTHQFIDYLFK